MSATIHTMPIFMESSPNDYPVSGDRIGAHVARRRRPVQGQLWERIESAGHNLTALPLYSARIADAYRRTWRARLGVTE